MIMFLNSRFKKISLTSLLLLAPAIAKAEKLDFGGSDEAYKGKGDLTPPQCQIDIPRASTEPFFIKWHCTDDVTAEGDIRSELWVNRRDDDQALRKIGSFLGFPAATFIDENALQVKDFLAGIPASFRLIAYDRAGNTSVTPFLQVAAQDNSVSTCDLQVVTEQTESTGDTTGKPALNTLLQDAPVTSSQIGNTDLSVVSNSPKDASPCEVETICADGNEITFIAKVSLNEADEAEGTLTINPGEVVVTIEGSAEITEDVLQSASFSGIAEIDGASATVTLSCEGK